MYKRPQYIQRVSLFYLCWEELQAFSGLNWRRNENDVVCCSSLKPEAGNGASTSSSSYKILRKIKAFFRFIFQVFRIVLATLMLWDTLLDKDYGKRFVPLRTHMSFYRHVGRMGSGWFVVPGLLRNGDTIDLWQPGLGDVDREGSLLAYRTELFENKTTKTTIMDAKTTIMDATEHDSASFSPILQNSNQIRIKTNIINAPPSPLKDQHKMFATRQLRGLSVKFVDFKNKDNAPAHNFLKYVCNKWNRDRNPKKLLPRDLIQVSLMAVVNVGVPDPDKDYMGWRYLLADYPLEFARYQCLYNQRTIPGPIDLPNVLHSDQNVIGAVMEAAKLNADRGSSS
mmetsp:Transcript_3412/g.6380  ORF Transcript_3412/g.6380 Transcript_3412/m.6380 type:complete len:340 (+) Transcript_3412:1-1020(+)